MDTAFLQIAQHFSPLQPAGLVISGADAAANGPYTMTVVTNDGTFSAAQTILWNVNAPLELAAPADQTTSEGATVSLSLSARAAVSGSTLSYAALGLPPGLKIHAGTITGTVALGTPTDPTASPSWPRTAPLAPPKHSIGTSTALLPPPAPTTQTNNAGDTVALTIGVTDSAGGTLVYSVQGLPPSLSINAATGVISGTVATTADTSNPYNVEERHRHELHYADV